MIWEENTTYSGWGRALSATGALARISEGDTLTAEARVT
jgi:hypothetical protein